ncbi:MAG: hypothetical protein H0V39_03390 [Nitrosomonas sp.]|nr:hypothetical protein [Nitrosomonas sp.]
MSIKSIKPLTLAVGTAIVTSFTVGNASAATDSSANPFAMTELSSGYMQLIAENTNENKKSEVNDGYGEKKHAKDDQYSEGKAGDKKEMKKEMSKDMEGKCGEGKCGNNK